MPLTIIRDDITKIKVDAIVNAANNTLLGGGGVDGAIHNAAGSELLEECMTLGGCATGDAKITRGYKLPAKYVIHTVGPIWHGGDDNEEALLKSCYKKSLEIAREHNLNSIAFPLISAGVYGYPKAQAFKVAVDTINAYLSCIHDIDAYIVLFDSRSTDIANRLFYDIQQFIDDVYVDEMNQTYGRSSVLDNYFDYSASVMPRYYAPQAPTMPTQNALQEPTMPVQCAPQAPAPAKKERKIPNLFKHNKEEEQYEQSDYSIDLSEINEFSFTLDESFAQMLLRKIDESGMTDPECYKKANVDRKLFSKIKNNPDYKPSKATVIAFAIALELDLNEAKDMLLKAGFALSHSNIFDVIIEYFITKSHYDMFDINEMLFRYDQPLLGA